MQSTTWLINKIQEDFPSFLFKDTGKFLWSAERQTIHIDTRSTHCVDFTLHELSHALLNHQGYRTDIELIKLERDAWEYAQTYLGDQYECVIDENVIQDNLDTYRDWLHARSKCPDCTATGLQTRSQRYQCLACGHGWRVNEARICALRRYSLSSK